MDATVATFDTVETADCVESCPVPGFESSLVVATYQLHKAADIGEPEDRRSGTLQHFHLASDGSTTDGASVTVEKLQDMATSSGIFDIKWSTKALNGKAVLGAATAGGSLELYELEEHDLCHSGLATEADSDSMCLSLDWSNRVHAAAQPSVCVSHSDGALSVWDIAPQGIAPQAKWRAHELYGSPIEAWIVAFNAHDPNVLFSGADDAVLKGWDLRQRNDDASFSPIFKNSRQYSMGVCSVQFHPHDEHLVAVGSYDEQVCVWDHRSMTRPLAVYGAGGGVWRLKWHPSAARKELLLAACMHNGFQVLELGASSLDQVVSYDRHESLAYGVDWWLHPSALDARAPVVGSASFYDHAFHVWRKSCPGV